MRERWSTIKLSGSSAPKGDRDALESAKKELGPFRAEHRDDLLYLCPCEECVEKFIIDIAAKFNARKLLIESAPRQKAMQQSFQRVSDAARNLAIALIELDDYSRIHLIEPDEIDRPYLERLYQAAAASKLPTPETEDAPATNGPFVETLLKLDSYVSLRSRSLASWNVSEPVVDRGGNTNVVKQWFGPAAAYLVSWCWIAFENCRPDTATGSENGPFVAFVNAVYSYATDQIEENSTLLHWTKKLAKPLRHHDRCLRRYGQIETELEDLRAKAFTQEVGAPIVELERELEIAKQALLDAAIALNQQIISPGKIPPPS
ncbi:hypothetical protein [Bradyrhizobium sp. Arg816]|uniref:hypothetical protein n=1 Tax=Bradyrhizobium sp. Arg816 TaxID=2998491 RepID=UPI00249DB2E6|nr:hypothetical protein [Bradyrhizobium sp. Arg816]MDI3561131.1 hypothetical protein [Bradyrhizobium sp. Arg816]